MITADRADLGAEILIEINVRFTAKAVTEVARVMLTAAASSKLSSNRWDTAAEVEAMARNRDIRSLIPVTKAISSLRITRRQR